MVTSLSILTVVAIFALSVAARNSDSLAQADTHVQDQCTQEAKEALYQSFVKNRAVDTAKAYEQARDYLRCPTSGELSEQQQKIIDYLKKWCKAYEEIPPGTIRLTDHAIGTIEIETSRGVVQVQANGRTLKLFGKRLKADDLMGIVAAKLRPTAEQKFSCEDEMLHTAAFLLAEVRDARVFGPLIEISESSCPNSCTSTIFGLQKLGDRRALPRLFEILRQRDYCAWAAVEAIAKIGDETAITHLIDTIPAGGAIDSDPRLKAIEEITGLSLHNMREKWGLLYYNNLEQFKKAMREWWEEHKHLAKIKKDP